MKLKVIFPCKMLGLICPQKKNPLRIINLKITKKSTYRFELAGIPSYGG